MGSHSFFRGDYSRSSNPTHLHYRQILFDLSHKEIQSIIEQVPKCTDSLSSTAETSKPLTCIIVVVVQCAVVSDSSNSTDCSLSAHGDSPDKNTGVGCQVLLHGIFLTPEVQPILFIPNWFVLSFIDCLFLTFFFQ